MGNGRLTVGIAGGTGYTGAELVRILALHPHVEIDVITSESHAGKQLEELHPHLSGIHEHPLVKLADADLDSLDLLFLALPHRVSMKTVAELKGRDLKIVDLSGDFRLSNADVYSRWYGVPHVCPELIDKAVYGLPELNREQIRDASLVANPGCFPTSVILGLAPLLKAGLIEPSGIVVDSKSGVTGAGVKPKAGTHFPTVNDSFRAYGLGTHRHTPEMEEILSHHTGNPVMLQFTPHLLPVNRGILSTMVTQAGNVDGETVAQQFSTAYADEPFVRLRTEPPGIADVRGSNRCELYVMKDDRTDRVIVVSVIDNLVKGAAGQAIQNMNLMLGFAETEGLNQPPLAP